MFLCNDGVGALKCKTSNSYAGYIQWHLLNLKIVIGGSLHSSSHLQSLEILLHRYTTRCSIQLHVSSKFHPTVS